jgi:hypothetical protein
VIVLYHQNYSNVPLPNTHGIPPGYYMYSNQLIKTMNITQPNYWVRFEPIFFHHLMLHLNKKLIVKTINETLEGILNGVAVDHLQLNINNVDYHIRIEHVIHFRLAT